MYLTSVDYFVVPTPELYNFDKIHYDYAFITILSTELHAFLSYFAVELP